MKKILALYLLLQTGFLFAQNMEKDTVMAAGLGFEFNMNARDNFAGGAAVGFDYSFADAYAAGINFTFSHNFGDNMVLEPATMFRWYFLGIGHNGFFAQADLGGYFIFEDDDVIPMLLGGLRGGFRFPLDKFYVEPFGRVGYPFAFGVGVMAGVRF